jgi:hypothetical protein
VIELEIYGTTMRVGRGADAKTVAAVILAIWIEQTEGPKFWLRIMNELKNRSVGDILIAPSTPPARHRSTC